MNIQTVLKKLIKKGSLTEKTPELTFTTPSHQEVPPKAHGQYTPASKTPKKSTPSNKIPKNITSINTSIHNPNRNTNAVNISELVNRMDTFEGNVNKILHILTQVQATTPNDHNEDQDTDTHMETQIHNTTSQ